MLWLFLMVNIFKHWVISELRISFIDKFLRWYFCIKVNKYLYNSYIDKFISQIGLSLNILLGSLFLLLYTFSCGNICIPMALITIVAYMVDKYAYFNWELSPQFMTFKSNSILTSLFWCLTGLPTCTKHTIVISPPQSVGYLGFSLFFSPFFP